MKYLVAVNGEEIEVTLDGSLIRTSDVEAEGRVADLEGTPIRMVTVGPRVYRVLMRRGSAVGKYVIHLDGFRFDVEAVDERTRAIRQLAGTTATQVGLGPLMAPMPGLIVRVLAQPGDRVTVGQGLVVMEAMKMENELRAASGGVVKAVRVAAGDAVEKGAILIDLA
jgi:biotin carboxyl carrier protein